MKRFLSAIALLLAGISCAYAQTITQSVAIGLDAGESDNVTSTLVGPGVNVLAFGYTADQNPNGYGGYSQCYWCNSGAVEAPGTSLNPSLQLVFVQIAGSLTYGGQTYCQGPGGCVAGSSGEALTTSQNITLPTNATGGQVFTFTVPAEAGSFTVTLDNGENLGLSPNPTNGELTLSFVAFGSPDNPFEGYSFSGGTFTTAVSTPEPGPLGLMAAGLVGILGLGLKRRLQAFSTNR